MSRALFVDLDGELHATHGRAEAMLEFDWFPILLRLLEPHQDVQLVVHASARRTSPTEFIGSRLELSRQGLYTCVKPPRLERWPSIQAWLGERLDITSFRILDDRAGEFPSPALDELILCDPAKGISEPRVQEALQRYLRQ